MKSRLSIICIFLIAGLVFSGCGRSFSKYPAGDIHIMVISDVHISRDESKDFRLESLISDINSGVYPALQGLFVTGDCVSKVYGDTKNGIHLESSNNLTKLIDLLRPLPVPYFLVMGNHDYKIDSDKDSDAPFSRQEIDTMEAIWKKYTHFEPYYSVHHSGWKFIILNSMRGRYLDRAFDPVQIAWFETELAAGQPVLMFFHHPIETDHFNLWGKRADLITPEKEPRFYQLCVKHKEQIKGIFVGHGHRWIEDTLFERIPVFETDSFGESDETLFYLIGIDTVEQKIRVSRSPVLTAREIP